MGWFRRSRSPISLPEPLSAEEHKRLRKKCVAPLKALQSCLRANPNLPLACARLESRAIECFAEVICTRPIISRPDAVHADSLSIQHSVLTFNCLVCKLCFSLQLYNFCRWQLHSRRKPSKLVIWLRPKSRSIQIMLPMTAKIM